MRKTYPYQIQRPILLFLVGMGFTAATIYFGRLAIENDVPLIFIFYRLVEIDLTTGQATIFWWLLTFFLASVALLVLCGFHINKTKNRSIIIEEDRIICYGGILLNVRKVISYQNITGFEIYNHSWKNYTLYIYYDNTKIGLHTALLKKEHMDEIFHTLENKLV